MAMKTLIAAAVAAAFALPLATMAGGDKASSGSTASPSASQSQGSASSGTSGSAGAGATGSANSGAEKMFQALDKNKDGFISKEEAQGTPHAKDFATLDKNGDGKLSRQEHAAAPEHASEKSSTGSSASGGASQSKPSKY